jgi:hypothetical protein
MSQILKLKRGSLERLSSITGSLQKGEVIFASASSNITADNGSSIAFVTVESGSIQAVNRVMKGDIAPQLTASQYIGIIDGIPFYASGSNSLVLLSSSGNEVINLEGNISEFSASVALAFSASNASIQSVTGDFSSSVATSFSASAFTLSQLSSSVATSFSASAAALEAFSASLDATFATDIALSAVSQSISASEAYLSASISSSLASNFSSLSSSIATSFSASSYNLAELSASVSGTINTLSSSVLTSFSASSYTLTELSTSIDSRIDALESFSSSLDSTFATDIELSAVSQSLSASAAFVSESISASLASGFNDLSSSVATSFSASSFTLLQLSASVSGTIAELSTSVDSRLDLLETTASYLNTTFSTSVDSRLDSLELFSSSLDDTFATDLAVSVISQSISASQSYISESIATSLAALSQSSGFINYVTNSVEQLTGIEVADFDNNTAVTFTNGVLKFIFGTPTAPTSVAASLSGFATDRFNKVTDTYSVNGTWNNQGYTLVSASLYEGATLLTQVGSGTSLTYSTTTSGSHTYQLQYTASSPLDNSLYTTSTTTTGTLSKSNPAAPTTERSVVVQLGSTSNQIEQGATGSITFTSSSANPSNSWNLTSVTTNVPSPYYITGSATGSTSISITATANYASTAGDNSPDLTTTSTATTTYTKIRSLRHGASAATSFTAAELENLGAWDTTLGGTIGTIVKGTTTASGQSVTISWTGDKYHYIVFNSSLSNLSNITTSGFGVLGSFAVTTVGQYKVYKTTSLQAGGAGSSITYILT